MLALVLVLAVTTVAATAAAVYYAVRPPDPAAVPKALDESAATALDGTPRPAGAVAPTRRLITIEILNPIELAGTRGRLIGIAGSLAPGLTRRVVYDQVLKILKRELVQQNVVADVRLHVLRMPPEPGRAAVDESRHVDLDAVPDAD